MFIIWAKIQTLMSLISIHHAISILESSKTNEYLLIDIELLTFIVF